MTQKSSPTKMNIILELFFCVVSLNIKKAAADRTVAIHIFDHDSMQSGHHIAKAGVGTITNNSTSNMKLQRVVRLRQRQTLPTVAETTNFISRYSWHVVVRRQLVESHAAEQHRGYSAEGHRLSGRLCTPYGRNSYGVGA